MPPGHRILVVDDDEIIRKLIRDLLEATHHDVEEAPGAVSAGQALRGGEFEVVLTDLMLPDGSGLDVLATARARPRGRLRLPDEADFHAEAAADRREGHRAEEPQAGAARPAHGS
jgi:CheY-like chemotaxis protein